MLYHLLHEYSTAVSDICMYSHSFFTTKVMGLLMIINRNSNVKPILNVLSARMLDGPKYIHAYYKILTKVYG